MDIKPVTGDHAENVGAITRNQQKKNLMDALPKKAQELLAFQIRRCDGRSSVEAEKWLKDIEEWMAFNELCLIGVFDLLLTDEAGTLWRNFKTETTTREEATAWFQDTFLVKKSFTDLLMELADVRQKEDERFATFEIRVRNLLEMVLDPQISRDNMVRDLLAKRAKNSGFKEALITRPKSTMEDVRELAKLYEAQGEPVRRTEQVAHIKQNSYAEVTQKKTWVDRPSNYARAKTVRENSEHRVSNTNASFQSYGGRDQRDNRSQWQSRPDNGPIVRQQMNPTVSMKHVARKIYNRSRGLPEPREEFLRPGQCFCCGEDNHVRAQCPLKDKCLICGNSDHLFRMCPLLGKSRESPKRQILCIHDEEDDGEEIEIEEEKNRMGPVVHISSVGSSQ